MRLMDGITSTMDERTKSFVQYSVILYIVNLEAKDLWTQMTGT